MAIKMKSWAVKFNAGVVDPVRFVAGLEVKTETKKKYAALLKSHPAMSPEEKAELTEFGALCKTTADEEPTNHATPMPHQSYINLTLCLLHQAKMEELAFVVLTWRCCARSADTLALQVRDVRVQDQGHLVLDFVRSKPTRKGEKRREDRWTSIRVWKSAADREVLKWVRTRVAEEKAEDRLFRLSPQRAVNVIKMAGSTYSAHSLKRGALQRVADLMLNGTLKVDKSLLRRMARHRDRKKEETPATLIRYLEDATQFQLLMALETLRATDVL